jgi:methyl-accepting chemotaxis protein
VNPARWNELCVYLNRNWEYWQDQLENIFVGDVYGYAHCGAFEVLGIPTSGIPINVEGRGGNYWARTARGETAFGDLEQSPVPTHDFLASSIAVPVKDSSGRVCGLAAVAIDSRPVMTHIQNNAVGVTGYTVLLDRYGRILSHPNAEYCLHGLPDDGSLTETYLEDLSGTGWADLQENMVAQEDGSATVTQGGKKYQVYYQSVDPVGEYAGMGLSVASVISDSELHEEANSMRNTIIIIALIAILVAVVLSYWVARMITKPMKDLQDAADKISKGDMEVAINIKSKDEVGDLAESFNRMVQAVKYLMQDKD